MDIERIYSDQKRKENLSQDALNLEYKVFSHVVGNWLVLNKWHTQVPHNTSALHHDHVPPI